MFSLSRRENGSGTRVSVDLAMAERYHSLVFLFFSGGQVKLRTER